MIDEMRKEDLQKLQELLKPCHAKEKKVFIGFDGFIDEVVHVVKKRQDPVHYERFEYLADYGNMIAQSGGLSLNVEMVTIRKKFGGNGAIMAGAMASMGIKATYMGACGMGRIDPAFQDFARQVKLISISNPGHTDAIEFKDGKIISSKLEALGDVSWESILRAVSIEELAALFEEADLLGFGNWSLLIHMTDIWKHILKDVAPKLSKRKKLFIDLANPAKRTKEDLLEALQCIKSFRRYFDVTLGLNKKEAMLIFSLIGQKDIEQINIEDILLIGASIREYLQLSVLVIHSAERSYAVSERETISVCTPICRDPKQVTGAGDSFNAGFALGQLLEVGVRDALILGTSSAGFYIRNARNADRTELLGFLEDWADGRLE